MKKQDRIKWIIEHDIELCSKGTNRIYSPSNITRDVKNKVLNTYVSYKSIDEVYGVIDTTVFGGADRGITFTDTELFIHNLFENPKSVIYSFYNDGESLGVDNVDFNEYWIIELIKKLAICNGSGGYQLAVDVIEKILVSFAKKKISSFMNSFTEKASINEDYIISIANDLKEFFEQIIQQNNWLNDRIEDLKSKKISHDNRIVADIEFSIELLNNEQILSILGMIDITINSIAKMVDENILGDFELESQKVTIATISDIEELANEFYINPYVDGDYYNRVIIVFERLFDEYRYDCNVITEVINCLEEQNNNDDNIDEIENSNTDEIMDLEDNDEENEPDSSEEEIDFKEVLQFFQSVISNYDMMLNVIYTQASEFDVNSDQEVILGAALKVHTILCEDDSSINFMGLLDEMLNDEESENNSVTKKITDFQNSYNNIVNRLEKRYFSNGEIKEHIKLNHQEFDVDQNKLFSFYNNATFMKNYIYEEISKRIYQNYSHFLILTSYIDVFDIIDKTICLMQESKNDQQKIEQFKDLYNSSKNYLPLLIKFGDLKINDGSSDEKTQRRITDYNKTISKFLEELNVQSCKYISQNGNYYAMGMNFEKIYKAAEKVSRLGRDLLCVFVEE